MEEHHAQGEPDEAAMQRLYDHLDEIQQQMDDLRSASPGYHRLCEEVEANDGWIPAVVHTTYLTAATQAPDDGMLPRPSYSGPVAIASEYGPADEGYHSANFPQPSPSQDLAIGPQRIEMPDDCRLLLPGTNIWSEYTSVILTYHEYVLSWKNTFGYTDAEMSLILQYFEQVSQVAGQKAFDEIFAQRTPESMAGPSYADLHPLDNLRVFDQDQRPGIPSDGYVLSADSFPTGSIPPVEEQKQWNAWLKSERWQLVGYKMSWEPLPIGMTCIDILRSYPNHILGEFLDTFAQHGFTSRQMLQWIPDDIQEKLVQSGALNLARNNKGEVMSKVLDSRRASRRDKRRRWFGSETEASFISSEIYIRQSGLPREN